MDNETKRRLGKKAIALMKQELERGTTGTPQIPNLADATLPAVANGHLQDPPVYPSFKPDTFNIREDNDRPGYFWVACKYKLAQDSQWFEHSTIFSYSGLR